MQRQASLGRTVLAKIRERRSMEMQNCPPPAVCCLKTTLTHQQYQGLSEEIMELNLRIKAQDKLMQHFEELQMQLDMSGKKPYPRIVIRPDFLASSKIDTFSKEFYRKSSNTYLRSQLLRRQAYEMALQKERELSEALKRVSELQEKVRKKKEEDNKELGRKRVGIVQQQLKVDGLRSEQAALKQTIQFQAEEHSHLIKEYKIKKEGLEDRKRRLEQYKSKVSELKQRIETQYCPQSYRKHLAKTFSYTLKNQALKSQLKMLQSQLRMVQGDTKPVKRGKNTTCYIDRSFYSKASSVRPRLTQSFVSSSSGKHKRLTTQVSRASPDRSWQFRSVSLG